MVISKNDGLFDSNFNLIKDQLICVHQICTLPNKKHSIEIIKGPDKIQKKKEKIVKKEEKKEKLERLKLKIKRKK